MQMKNHLISYLLLSFCLLALPSMAQMPDNTMFEALQYVYGNDTLPYRIYRSVKADTMTEAPPLVIFCTVPENAVTTIARN